MYKILICSHSMVKVSELISKMKKIVESNNIDAIIWSVVEEEICESWMDSDVILLEPKGKYFYKTLKKIVKDHAPIGIIDENDFNKENADAVLSYAISLIEENM